MHSILCVISSALPYVVSFDSVFLPWSAKERIIFKQCVVAPNIHTLDFIFPIDQGGTSYFLEACLLPDL